MLSKYDLKECFRELHGTPQPTRKDSTRTIDSIWCSSSLKIRQAGYSPYGDGISKDHRIEWIDVTAVSAFGCNVPKVIAPVFKQVRYDNPKIRKKFNELYKQKLHDNGALERTKSLSKDIKFGYHLTAAQQHEYEIIDSLKLQAVEYASKNCRKKQMGGVPFSGIILKCWNEIEAWSLLWAKFNGRKVKRKFLRRSFKKIKVNPDRYTKEECKIKLAQAKKRYKLRKKDATNLRENFLLQLAEAHLDEKKGTLAGHIKSLVNTEETRLQFRKIKYILGKICDSGISMVMLPDSNGNQQIIQDRQPLEKALLAESESKYKLAFTTPPLMPPLRNVLGKSGLGHATTQIVEGCFTPPHGIDDGSRLWFQAMEKTPLAKQHPVYPTKITEEEYIQGWKKAKHRTSSNPIGPDYNVYKSTIHDDTLTNFETMLLNIPYQTGYSPSRWRNALDILLRKQKDDLRLTKLRTIGLLEADFNFMCKYLGHWAMSKAQDFGQLAHEQYGSRKRHQAIALALNKRLAIDMAAFQRVALVLCSQDAMQCFDRICHAALAIGLKRQNLPDTAIEALILTIEKMTHKVRTIFGESSSTYGGDSQGIPQGCGMGPPGWAIISTGNLDMLRQEGYGAKMTTPITNVTLEFVGYAYVDDTDQIETQKFADDDVYTVIDRMQKAVDLWEKGIRATGGAIRPEKCHWYAVDFKWNGSNWSYKSTDELPAQLTVKNSEGTRQQIKRLALHQSEVTLGVHCSPFGCMKRQVEKMTEQSKDWGCMMRAGHLDRQNTHIALDRTLWKTLSYPLSATTLSESECETIMRPALNVALSKMGLNRHFPRDLVFSPTHFQGLGIKHLYTLQAIAHLTDILNHQLQTSSTTILHRGTFEYLFLQLGIGSEFLSFPRQAISTDIPLSVAKSLWFFCSKYQITVSTDINCEFLRENDSFIMEHLYQSNASDEELLTCNRCRIYLQVLTISEITTGDGLSLLTSSLRGERLCSPLRNWSWPKQPRPSKSEWRVWNRLLQSTICRFAPNQLVTPLGKWTATHSTRWWYSPSDQLLFYGPKTPTQPIQCWTPSSPHQRGPSKRYVQLSFTSAAPTTVYPAVCEQLGDRVTFTGYSPFATNPPPLDDRIEATIQTLPKSCQWALQRSEGWHHLADILLAFSSGTFVASTDGSFKDGRGSAAWRICDFNHPRRCIKGVLLSPGDPEYQDSTRAELAGLYAIACAIWVISKLHTIDNFTVTVGCDSTSALEKILPSTYLKCSQAHYDLAHSVKSLIRQTHLRWALHHVEGHQNRHKAFHDLDLWAKMNVYCDRAAGIFRVLATRDKLDATSLELFHAPWTIQLDNIQALNDLPAKLHAHVQKKKALSYWASHKYAPDSCDDIHWTALTSPMQSLSTSRRHWVIKSASDWLPTNKNKFRWKQVTSPNCPFCNQPEDAQHVQTCSHPVPTAYRRQHLAPLESKLRSYHTAPLLSHLLLQGLRTVWPETPCPTTRLPSSPSHRITNLKSSQNTIGWWNLLGGKWSIHWYTAQQTFLSTIQSAKSPRRWQSSVIQLLWNTAWDFWQFRNHQDHAQSPSLLTDKHQLLLTELRYQWNLGPPSPFERHLYRGTFQELSTSTVDYQAAWVRCVQVARKACSRASHRQAQATDRSSSSTS